MGEMLTKPEGTLTSDTFIETEKSVTTTTTLDEKPSGEIAGLMWEEIAQGRKRWEKLVEEVVESGEKPPLAILIRLGFSHQLTESNVAAAFANDCKALKEHRAAIQNLAKSEQKLEDYTTEHGTEVELQRQLQEIKDSERELRSLINKIQHVKFNLGRNTATLKRLESSHPRISFTG
jgi:hypothetical protein